jgi:hypothetical protein
MAPIKQKELLDLPYKLLHRIFEFAVGNNFMTFLLLRKLRNKTVKHHVEVVWEKTRHLRFTTNDRIMLEEGEFDFFAVNEISFPKLVPYFVTETVPGLERALEIRHGSQCELFLEFLIQCSPRLNSIAFHHDSFRIWKCSGLYLLYTYIRRLIQRYNLTIRSLNIEGPMLIKHPQFGLIPLVQVCSSTLKLTLDDINKFIPSLTRQETFAFNVDTLVIRKCWPIYHEEYFGRLLSRMPNLRVLKMVLDWKSKYPVEARHTMSLIQDFISFYRNREAPVLFNIFPLHPRNCSHFIMILEILAEDNPGAEFIRSDSGLIDVKVGSVLVRLFVRGHLFY